MPDQRSSDVEALEPLPAEEDGTADDAVAGLQAELEGALDEQAELRAELARAQDRAADLEWRLDTVKGSRGYQLLQLMAQVASPRGASRAQLVARLPARATRIIRTRTKPRSRPASVKHRDQRAQRGWEALENRDYGTALTEAEAVLATAPGDYAALELKQTALWRRGEVSESVAAFRPMRDVRDSPALAWRQRDYIGRARELDPRWLPRVPGPPQPVEPRPGVIMHLLKESVPYYSNGYTTRSRYTVQCQRDAGLDPFVVTSLGFPRKDGFSGFKPVEEVEGTPYYRIDLGPDYPYLGPHDRVLSDTAWLAARIARDKRPEVIHASTGYRGFETALVGMALRAHLGRPLVYDVHSFLETAWTGDNAIAEQGEHYRARLAAEVRAMEGADHVLTISEGMRAEIIARGIPADKVGVVPNGVNPERFTPAEPSPALRRTYGLDGTTVLGYISNLDHAREGQEVLIEATARLRRAGRAVTCLLVGDGQRREELEELAAQAGPGAVVFTGNVPHEQVRDFYALIDIFVVPRIDERAARLVTPLKPFEAMAMRRPMIVSDLPALAEVVKPGERGLTFTPGDAQSLARAVETYLDNPGQAAVLAEQGRRWVLAERSWAANSQRYLDVYSEVAARWAAGAVTTGGQA